LQERVRAFIEDTSDKDVLMLNVQDPFQRLLLHGVCEVSIFPSRRKSNSFLWKNSCSVDHGFVYMQFYNVTSTTASSVRDGRPWKTTTIKKRQGTGVPSAITLVNFLRMKKNGSH